MILDIDGLEVLFPFEYIYPEQYEYMLELKRVLDAKGHGVLEMPCGTGKTISILSVILSYSIKHPHAVSLSLCTSSRTCPRDRKGVISTELTRLLFTSTPFKEREETSSYLFVVCCE